MTTIQVRNNGTYGFEVTSLSGLGLSSTEAAETRSQVQDALALGDALRQALADARDDGVVAFKPSDSLLVIPAGLSNTSRDALFDNVIGRVYSGGPLSLQEWSQAADALDHWAAAQSSMLPPEAGGGSRVVQGTWYVNGLPWSLSELFTVNRVNTLAEIDRLVADSLNVIAANNETAKALTGLLQKLDKKYSQNLWTEDYAFSRISKTWVDAVGTVEQDDGELAGKYPDRHVWKEGSECFLASDGASALERPVAFSQLLAYADKYVGPNSITRKLNDLPATGGSNANGDIGITKDDFRALLDEVETIIAAFGADNQVAQLRNETLFNSRSNLLEGLSTFLRGQQTTRSELARNA